MFNKGKYILLQIALFTVSPISSFLLTLRLYKSAISQVFFILFATYFGFYMGFVFDLMRHYQDMLSFYVDRPLDEILNDPRIFILGPDYYHVTVKYLVSRFTTSHAVFGSTVAFVYASSFMFFYGQLKQFYSKRLSYFSILLLICVVTVVEFWWYQGVRFWTGVFFFMGMYLKYINTSKKGYLFLSLLSIYFHYTLITVVLAALINYGLSFVSKYYRYGIFAFSFFYKTLNFDFVPLLLKYVPWARDNLSIAITDERIHNNMRDYIAEFRASENVVYGYRLPFLAFAAIIVLLIFKLNKIKFNHNYLLVFYLSITIWSIANFGFGDITFYQRFFEVAVLSLYVSVFALSATYQKQVKRYRLALTLFLILPVLYAILPTFVQYRALLMQPELFFGSFFMEWDGNALKINYAWK